MPGAATLGSELRSLAEPFAARHLCWAADVEPEHVAQQLALHGQDGLATAPELPNLREIMNEHPSLHL